VVDDLDCVIDASAGLLRFHPDVARQRRTTGVGPGKSKTRGCIPGLGRHGISTDEILVRDRVLRAWGTLPARSGARAGQWRHGARRPCGSLGRCVRLIAGLGAGLGVLMIILVVSAVLLPPLLMIVPHSLR
jgi:hypothetical protein